MKKAFEFTWIMERGCILRIEADSKAEAVRLFYEGLCLKGEKLFDEQIRIDSLEIEDEENL
jgi:hypothetical protein